jgi:hypothetical protein
MSAFGQKRTLGKFLINRLIELFKYLFWDKNEYFIRVRFFEHQVIFPLIVRYRPATYII